ncbi:MAG: hypothetical protein Q9196_007268, partial [Gyalolechia fulgens]
MLPPLLRIFARPLGKLSKPAHGSRYFTLFTAALQSSPGVTEQVECSIIEAPYYTLTIPKHAGYVLAGRDLGTTSVKAPLFFYDSCYFATSPHSPRLTLSEEVAPLIAKFGESPIPATLYNCGELKGSGIALKGTEGGDDCNGGGESERHATTPTMNDVMATTRAVRFLVAGTVKGYNHRIEQSAHQVRSETLLQSALDAPANNLHYGNVEDPVRLAAILSSRIIKNHPFANGNKRTALMCANLFLAQTTGKVLQQDLWAPADNDILLHAHNAIAMDTIKEADLAEVYRKALQDAAPESVMEIGELSK